MDRGFNYIFQGNRSNFGPNYRERADRSDRRYDDFYADNRNRMGPPGGRQGGAAVRRSGDWGGIQPVGFGNQGAPAAAIPGGGINSQMLLQQNIINALMSTQTAKGLLPSPSANPNMGQQYRPRNDNQMNKFRRGSGGGAGYRPGDKRKNDNTSGFKGKKFQPQSQAAKKKSNVSSTSKDSKEKEKEEEKEEEIDIPDDEVEIPDSLMDSVEKLRQRTEVERNVADEDVQKLMVFCFTGKGYQCKTCGLLLMKESAFSNHLNSKSHVMNVIDARTAKKYQEIRDVLEIDLTPDDWFEKNEKARAIILKQSKLHMKTQRELKKREEINYNKTPSNFFNFNMEMRKSVTKVDEKVVITSLVESTVEVKDFTEERFFGCEFVRAVTGFHCRLCSINIREARGVIPHVDSRQHKNNYQAYVKKNADYEKMQKEQNQDLLDIMQQHESKSIVLAESSNVEASHFLSLVDPELVRIPSVMNPELKKKEKEEKEREEKEEKEKKEKEEKEAADAAKKEEAPEEDAETESKEEKDEQEAEEGGAEDEEKANEEGGDDEEEEQVDEEEAEQQEEPMEQEVNGIDGKEQSEDKDETETAANEEDDKSAEEGNSDTVSTETAKEKEVPKGSKKGVQKTKAADQKKSTVKPKAEKKAPVKRGKAGAKAVAKTAKDETKEDASDDGFEVVDEVE